MYFFYFRGFSRIKPVLGKYHRCFNGKSNLVKVSILQSVRRDARTNHLAMDPTQCGEDASGGGALLHVFSWQ